MLIHVQLQLPVARAQTQTYLTNWHNIIFDYKVRVIKNKWGWKSLKS